MFVAFPIAAITIYLCFNLGSIYRERVIALWEWNRFDNNPQFIYRYVHPRDPTVAGKNMSISHPKSVQLIHDILGGLRPVNPSDYFHRRPVAVGYVSSNHVNELKINMPTWFPHFDRVVIYYMDKNVIYRRHLAEVFGDKIEIIDLPIKDHPLPISKTGSYAFKPFVMTDSVRRFGFVSLMDSCVRFPNNFTDNKLVGKYFEEKEGGACLQFKGPATGGLIPIATHPQMQEYVPHIQSEFEQLDGYMRVRQIAAGFITIMGSLNCFKNYLLPVFVCSLFSDCIDPPGAVKKLGVKGSHRWDQALANLVAGNMYGFIDSKKKMPRPTHTYHTPISHIFCRNVTCFVRNDGLVEFCRQRNPKITDGTCEGWLKR